MLGLVCVRVRFDFDYLVCLQRSATSPPVPSMTGVPWALRVVERGNKDSQ